MYSYEPKPYTYRLKRHTLTAEEEAKVRRRVGEARRRACQKLRDRESTR